MRYETAADKALRLQNERAVFHGIMCRVAENLEEGESIYTYPHPYRDVYPQGFVFCVKQGEGEPEIRMVLDRRYIGTNPFIQIEPSGYSPRWEKEKISFKKASVDMLGVLAKLREKVARKAAEIVSEERRRNLEAERIKEATKMLGFPTDTYRASYDRGEDPFERVTSRRNPDGSLSFDVVIPSRVNLSATGVKRLEAVLREEAAIKRSPIAPGAVAQRPHPDCTCFECADCHAPTVCAMCLICTTCSHHMTGCVGCPASYQRRIHDIAAEKGLVS